MPRGRPRSDCHFSCGTVDGNKSEPVKSRLFDKLQGFIHPECIGRISSLIFVVFFFVGRLPGMTKVADTNAEAAEHP